MVLVSTCVYMFQRACLRLDGKESIIKGLVYGLIPGATFVRCTILHWPTRLSMFNPCYHPRYGKAQNIQELVLSVTRHEYALPVYSP